jgi:hypothetical protein
MKDIGSGCSGQPFDETRSVLTEEMRMASCWKRWLLYGFVLYISCLRVLDQPPHMASSVASYRQRPV